MNRFVLLIIMLLVCQPAFAVQLLRQGQSVTVKIGPFVSSADGFTLMSSLTITQADIRLAKNTGAFAQTNNSAGAVADNTNGLSGHYDVPLDTADTGSLGKLRVFVNETGALPVWQDFLVVPPSVFDALVTGTGLNANVTTWASAAVLTPHTPGVPRVATDYIGSSPAVITAFAPTVDAPIVETTVAVPVDAKNFSITAGPTVSNSIQGWTVILLDVSAGETPFAGTVIAYSGASKIITLDRAPTFTPAAGDKVRLQARPRQ